MSDWQYQIRRILIQTPITDIQTNLFDPAFTGLTRSGLDELLTVPELVGRTIRTQRFDPAEFARASEESCAGRHRLENAFCATRPRCRMPPARC